MLEKCMVCERQDAANIMMDRIAELNEALSKRLGVSSSNAQMDAARDAIGFQDMQDAMEWAQLAHTLKFHKLTVAPEFKPAMTVSRELSAAVLARLPEEIKASKRASMVVLSGGKKRKKKPKPKKP